jgi:hypothetical protein
MNHIYSKYLSDFYLDIVEYKNINTQLQWAMCTIININVIIDTHILVKINSMLPSNLRILFSRADIGSPCQNCGHFMEMIITRNE